MSVRRQRAVAAVAADEASAHRLDHRPGVVAAHALDDGGVRGRLAVARPEEGGGGKEREAGKCHDSILLFIRNGFVFISYLSLRHLVEGANKTTAL